MSKAIRVTEEFKEEARRQFEAQLANFRSASGTFSFTKSVIGDAASKKALVLISPKAWVKMFMLVDSFTTEVQWHCSAKKLKDGVYEIMDVVVFPQIVTNATVDVESIKYQQWMFDLPDEIYDNLNCHCHSHVEMATNPSSTDIQYQQDMINDMREDGFYIFLICNRRRSVHARVYDLESNTLYENTDTTVLIYDGEFDYQGFVKDAKEVVEVKTYSTGKYKGSTGSKGFAGAKVQSLPAKTGGADLKKTSPAPSKGKASAADDEDDDNDAQVGNQQSYQGEFKVITAKGSAAKSYADCDGCGATNCYGCEVFEAALDGEVRGYGAFDSGYDGGYGWNWGRSNYYWD